MSEALEMLGRSYLFLELRVISLHLHETIDYIFIHLGQPKVN